MKPSPEFIDKLLFSERGRIVGSNLLSGLDVGLYTREFLVAVLTLWEQIVIWRGYSSDTHSGTSEIVGTLATLPELAKGRYPPGFSVPRIDLPELHVAARGGRP